MIQLAEGPGENFSFGQGLCNGRSSHRQAEGGPLWREQP